MEWQAFVGVIAIIGIVVVVGGLIAFLGHVIIGAFDNEDRSTRQPKQEVMDYTQYKQNLIENKPEVEKQQDYNFEAIDMAKAQKEQDMINENNKEDDLFKLVEDNDSNLEEIENRLKKENAANKESDMPATEVKTLEEAPMAVEEEKDDSAEDVDIQNLLDEINSQIVDEEKTKEDETKEEENPVLAAYDIDKILSQAKEDNEEAAEDNEEETVTDDEEVAQAAEEQTTETETTEETETKEEVKEEPVVVEDEATKQELEEANKRIAELTSQIANLNKQLNEQPEQLTEVVTIDMTEEECLNRIAVLEERLKNAKKDYKINMKEYRPLKKVMTDLERYQTKLRRKEAIVAKKKVALYGVNNYVDIDKEKAEKLANELELLDGLRLSVNHCEDVINANKDRFPILEHTNSILEEQIAQLEADLEQTNLTLQKIREREGKGEGENNQ